MDSKDLDTHISELREQQLKYINFDREKMEIADSLLPVQQLNIVIPFLDKIKELVMYFEKKSYPQFQDELEATFWDSRIEELINLWMFSYYDFRSKIDTLSMVNSYQEAKFAKGSFEMVKEFLKDEWERGIYISNESFLKYKKMLDEKRRFFTTDHEISHVVLNLWDTELPHDQWTNIMNISPTEMNDWNARLWNLHNKIIEFSNKVENYKSFLKSAYSDQDKDEIKKIVSSPDNAVANLNFLSEKKDFIKVLENLSNEEIENAFIEYVKSDDFKHTLPSNKDDLESKVMYTQLYLWVYHYIDFRRNIENLKKSLPGISKQNKEKLYKSWIIKTIEDFLVDNWIWQELLEEGALSKYREILEKIETA